MSSHGSSLCGVLVVRHKAGQDQRQIEHDVGESRNIGHDRHDSVCAAFPSCMTFQLTIISDFDGSEET